MAEKSQRQCLYLQRSGLSEGFQLPCDILIWETIQRGIIRFSPTCDMATYSMTKRRHFGTYCLALLNNFSASVYRSVELGALILCSTNVQQYHDWPFEWDGNSIWYGGRGGSSFIYVGLQYCSVSGQWNCCLLWYAPTLTRFVHLWAGRRRWRLKRRKLAATHLCILWGIVRLFFRNSKRTTLHPSHTWRCYFGRQE